MTFNGQVPGSKMWQNGNQQTLISQTVGQTASAGTNAVYGLRVGSAFTSSANFFNGDIAELIYFNDTISNSNRQLVELYLRTKYAPPVNLGPDIKILYGACDTTLKIEERFPKVLWSTGDTNTFNLKVRQSGKYWVRAPDIFGFVSSDTVDVIVPYLGITPVEDTIVCAGQSVELKYTINGSPYSFNWSTGDTGVSSITVNQPGNYFVQVSDTIGCTLTSDTINVTVDSLQFFSVLNDDTVACTNAPLGLIPYIYPYQTYQWSTSSTKDTVLVSGTGVVYVTVTDVNGCSTQDSINISRLKGVAPVVNFGYQNICLGDTTLFIDSTIITAPENIAIRQWTFGSNIPSDTVANPFVVFPNTSVYPVQLYVETDSGCFNSKSINLLVQIYYAGVCVPC
jgi:hypothetical protein